MDIHSLVIEQTPDPQNHSKIFGAIHAVLSCHVQKLPSC